MFGDEFFLAETVRFELTVPCGTLVFKTSAIDHSATLPSFYQVYFIFNQFTNLSFSTYRAHGGNRILLPAKIFSQL